MNPWLHSTYILRRQVFRVLGAGFEIFAPDGSLAFFSEQKAFKFKEDIRLYADREKRGELLRISARSVLDFGTTYDVFDPVDSEPVGALRRKALKSMFRDEWAILDVDGTEVGIIREDSLSLALLRRIVNIIPQRFVAQVGGQTVATYSQNWMIFTSKITLDFTADPDGRLDRRMGIAAAVLLCAIEGRQD